jgi:hypothetical protein
MVNPEQPAPMMQVLGAVSFDPLVYALSFVVAMGRQYRAVGLGRSPATPGKLSA